jgi:hypothetical protein
MKTIAVILCVFFSFSVAASQTAVVTITNKDLEDLSQKRQAAEREYRRTYAAKGLPSPEELRAQGDARERDFIDFAQQMDAANLERERLAVAAMLILSQQQQQQQQYNAPQYPPPGYYSPEYQNYGYGNGGYGYGGYGYGGYGYDPYGYTDPYGRPYRGRIGNGQGYYGSGGVMWPTPPLNGVRRPSLSLPRPTVRTRRK